MIGTPEIASAFSGGPETEALAAGSLIVGAVLMTSLRERSKHHAAKSAQRQNHGILSPRIYVPYGHYGIRERFRKPLMERDEEGNLQPQILEPGGNWVPFSSAVLVSTQGDTHKIVHESIENEYVGQIRSEVVVDWHIGEDRWQLFRSHYNYKNQKSKLVEDPETGQKVEVTPLELAAVGIIASGIRQVLTRTKKPFSTSDERFAKGIINVCKAKLDERCGALIADLSVPVIARSNGQMGVQAFREMGQNSSVPILNQGELSEEATSNDSLQGWLPGPREPEEGATRLHPVASARQ